MLTQIMLLMCYVFINSIFIIFYLYQNVRRVNKQINILNHRIYAIESKLFKKFLTKKGK